MTEDVGTSSNCWKLLKLKLLLFIFYILPKNKAYSQFSLSMLWRKLEYSWILECSGNVAAYVVDVLICKDRVIKGDFNMFYFSRFGWFIDVFWAKYVSLHTSLSLLFPSYPSSVFPPTGNRWEVKGVTCKGSGLLPLACQRLITHTYTHRIHYIPVGYGGETQLGAITGALQAHTCSPVADESDTPATSDPFRVLRNHHQHTLSWRILRTLLL